MLRSAGPAALGAVLGAAIAAGAAHALGGSGAAVAASAEAPLRGSQGLEPEAALAKAADGHYWADAVVDGAPVRFLVDTGASAVALTPQDAGRLGLDPAALRYDEPVRLAGGESMAAHVRLESVAIQGVRLHGVDALVVDHGLPASLLGMSYLGRLSRFEATPAALVLRP